MTENEPDVFTPWSEILESLRDEAAQRGKDWDHLVKESIEELDPDGMSQRDLDRVEKLANQYNIDLEEIWPEWYGS